MISFGILGHCGALEITETVAASVGTGVGRCLAFDGFEPIPSRDSGIRLNRLPWALFLSAVEVSTENSEHFTVRTPPKDYLPGDRTHLINCSRPARRLG